MVEILRNKNLATKFQILVEIANSGPNIQQRDIANRLDVTPQAISDYIKQLIKEGSLASDGRSRYKVTNNGVNWVIRVARELRNYSAFVGKAVTSISVCAAIADCNLTSGQTAGLQMKDGLLFATDQPGEGARGIVVSDARQGEDIGITNIEGIVALQIGKVTILKVPGIQKGGCRKVDFNQLQREVKGRAVIAAMGIEALVALRQVGANFYMYGAKEAVIEAARSGLQPLAVCVEDETFSLIRGLEEESIGYELIDLRKGEDQADT